MFNKISRISMIAFAISFVLLFILFSLAAVLSKASLAKIFMQAMPQRQFTSNINVLILGVDNTVDGLSRRSDTIMVANFNPNTQHIGLISIPRDTYVDIPGKGYSKVNHSYAFGGAELARQTMAQTLKIPIPYFIEINLLGLKDIVDEVGGVEVNIKRRMHYVDRAGDLYIDLYPGRQILNGDKALQYVRFRSDEKADIGRIERQQDFMQRLAKKMLKFSSIFRVPRIMSRFSSHIKTNIPSGQIVNLALKLREAYELGHLETVTLPGDPRIVNSINYWMPSASEIQKLVNRFLKGYELTSSGLPPLKRPEETTVEVLNGNGQPKLASNGQKILRQLGYRITDARSATHFNYPYTVLICWNKNYLEDEAYVLARKLYLHPAHITFLQKPAYGADFSLVIGKDWPLPR